jgi:uncharacterized membrane protein YkvA (DUF1232 family)
MNWKAVFTGLAREVQFSARIARHPDSPWLAKLIAGCALFYVLSPIQLIPTLIPVIGQLDDAVVLYLCVRLICKVAPEAVTADCRQADFSRSNIFGGESRRNVTPLSLLVIPPARQN